jgi:FxLD family lantipeptide
MNDDFELDLRLVDAGPAASGYATSTDDGCGSGNTGSDACSGGCSKAD